MGQIGAASSRPATHRGASSEQGGTDDEKVTELLSRLPALPTAVTGAPMGTP